MLKEGIPNIKALHRFLVETSRPVLFNWHPEEDLTRPESEPAGVEVGHGGSLDSDARDSVSRAQHERRLKDYGPISAYMDEEEAIAAPRKESYE
ncbi:hypothetical protein DL767_002940 [Monosporascus sp. MG133]|nr:hypothetical protein DL767_002940 [Monosporascus sp. MG133]